jgi:hypothetical protein
MTAPRDELPDLFTRLDARARGWTRDQVEWAASSGRWQRLRRGMYAERAHYSSLEPVARHLLDCRAAVHAHDERHVLSHLSAALSYGLPAPLDGPGRPTLTIGAPGASTDRQADLVVQVASLRDQDVASWREGRRTRPARTVADCLRHLPARDAVAIADAAVRQGLTDLARIEEVLRWQEGWPYLARGRAAYALVDPRRENWLESASAVTLHIFGIPLAVPQVEVYDERGVFIGRVDSYWQGHATVGEADGRAKYSLSDRLGNGGPSEPSEPKPSPSELADVIRRSLIREKEREDRLRDVGLEVVRWSMGDIARRPQEVADAVRRAFRRGRPERFTGSVRWRPAVPGLAVESGVDGLEEAG